MPDIGSQTTPIPNLERRAASAGIDESLKEQMKSLKNFSISSLNLINSKMFKMSLKGLSGSEQSELFMMEDITKFDYKGMYKSVAIVDSDIDTDEDESNKSDTN